MGDITRLSAADAAAAHRRPSLSRGSSLDKDEKTKSSDASSIVKALPADAVDEAAFVVAEDDDDSELDPAEGVRIRKKIDRHILPLMMVLYCMQFVDKTTLGSSANLGIKKSAHLDANHYNWLGSIFYIAYLAFEYPQSLALQRFPVGKWMSINILVWGIALGAQAACHSFTGLAVCRFVLGMCEGSITAGFLIVTSMFWTHQEQSKRVGYWFLMNGTAQIVAGFVSFGILHIKNSPLEPWQWYMLLTGIVTLCIAVTFWFLFPDNPQTAWFFTAEERVNAVRRIKSNNSGVENKHFKKDQFVEALLDPKTWLFALFSALDNIPNSLTNQRQIIVRSFGFSQLQTTLLGCVDGVIEIVTIWTAVMLVGRIRNSRAIVGAVYFIPNILGSILTIALPWSDKIGLLFSLWITGVGTSGFVLALGWVTSVTAGHTKRVTVNAIMLIAYCVGNLAGPQMWQAQYTPRNYVPWSVILTCYSLCPLILLIIRVLLNRENKARDAHQMRFDDTQHGGYVVEKREDGSEERVHVDPSFLDLTDRQNKKFRYVL